MVRDPRATKARGGPKLVPVTGPVHEKKTGHETRVRSTARPVDFGTADLPHVGRTNSGVLQIHLSFNSVADFDKTDVHELGQECCYDLPAAKNA